MERKNSDYNDVHHWVRRRRLWIGNEIVFGAIALLQGNFPELVPLVVSPNFQPINIGIYVAMLGAIYSGLSNRGLKASAGEIIKKRKKAENMFAVPKIKDSKVNKNIAVWAVDWIDHRNEILNN